MNVQILKRWVWGGAVTLAAAWSLAAWGVFALLGLSDEAVNASAPVIADYPQLQSWLAAGATAIESVGSAVLWIVWGVGLVGIVAAVGLALWLLGRANRRLYARVRPAH